MALRACSSVVSSMPTPLLTRCAGILCALLLTAGAVGGCGDGGSGSSGAAASQTSTADSTTSPAAENFAGDWQTTFGKLQLAESNDGVAGSYAFCDGKLTGVARGNRLEGSWEEDTSACEDPRSAARKVAEGTFSFTLDDTGNAFTGYYETTGSDQRKPWNGSRIVP